MESRLRTSAPSSGGGDAMPSLDGRSVLVIDDERSTRDVIAAMLRRCGADVVLASSAAEGHSCVAEHRPDVIVCDIAMPGEDGYSFIQRLRAHEARHSLPRLPALAVTAFASAPERQKALHAGFDAHFGKPIDSNALIDTLLQLLRES